MLHRVALVRIEVSEELSATRCNITEDTILQERPFFTDTVMKAETPK
jgi:hypothetical protein